ncbi:zf-HC2 domain-containing protein [Kitasatospora sp. HPMI-4]
MICAEYRTAMSARLDGERTTVVVGGEALAGHGERCADCRDWLAAARGLRALTAGAPGPSPEWSAGLVDRLLDRLAADGGEDARTA